VLAFLLGVPSLYQNAGYSVAFFAIVSIGTVGLYIAYIIPVFLRLRTGTSTRTVEPRRWSKPIGWVAVLWVCFISIVFFSRRSTPGCRPEGRRRERRPQQLHWAGPTMLVIFLIVGIWWLVSAKKWFHGPQVQGSHEELVAIERELAAIESGADPSTFSRLESETRAEQ